MTNRRIVWLACMAGLLAVLGLSALPAAAAGKTIRVVVAANGSGNFTTIQEAIDHAPPEGDGRLFIAIEPGVYRQRLVVPQDRPRVRVSWAHKLTATEVKQFLPDNFLRGNDDWQPAPKSQK